MIIKLAIINFRRTGGFFVAGVVSVAVGTFILVFFLGLVAGIGRAVESKLFPEGTIEAVTSSSDVVETVSFLSGGKGPSFTITPAKLAAARRIEGVGGVFPRLRFKFPMKLSGGKEIFGIESGTDIVGDGIPAGLISSEPFAPAFKDLYPGDSGASCAQDAQCSADECCFIGEGQAAGECRRPVPLILSGRLIEIYNKVIAPAHNLQQLPDWMIRKFTGMRLRLVAGLSYQGKASRGVPEASCARFVGLSDRATDIGISVPIEYARRWNAKYAQEYEAGSYSSVVIVAAQRKDLPRVMQDLRLEGLVPLQGWQEQVAFLIGLLNGIFLVISALMVFVSTIGISRIFYSIVFERRKEIGLMRALGASRGVIMGIFLLQGGVVGLAGGAIGVAGAVACSFIADRAAGAFLPAFPFKPDTFFAFEPWIIVLAVLLAAGSCVAGAFLPARRAARTNPMELVG